MRATNKDWAEDDGNGVCELFCLPRNRRSEVARIKRKRYHVSPHGVEDTNILSLSLTLAPVPTFLLCFLPSAASVLGLNGRFQWLVRERGR
jgi:hypothetical protein